MAEWCAEYQELKHRFIEEAAASIMENFNMTVEEFLVAPEKHTDFQTRAYAEYWAMTGENGQEIFIQLLRLMEDYNIECERI